MYLLLTGAYPENGTVCLPVTGLRLRRAEGAKAKMGKGICQVTVNEAMYADPVDVHVVKLTFDRPVSSMASAEPVSAKESLSWANAAPQYSYSCFDYYSNYRSTVGYAWNVALGSASNELEILYTADEEGRKIIVEADGTEIPVTLCTAEKLPSVAQVSIAESGHTRLRGGVFDGPESWEGAECGTAPESKPFVEIPVLPFCNYLLTTKVEADKAGTYVFEVTSGNGVEVVVNGAVQTKHLNPYRTLENTEKLLVDLPEGTSIILVRAYNRFENTLSFGLKKAEVQEIYSMKVKLPTSLKKGVHTLKLRATDRPSGHTDCELHNLRIKIK